MAGDSSSLKFLYGLQSFGIKAGLWNTQQLLSHFGNPERQFPSIHLAGTNGKGSTAAMIAAMAGAGGFRVGLYTSPHLVSFNERIRVDGRQIDDDLLAEYVRSIRGIATRLKATFFEVTTAIAFRYFADSQVQLAVVEVGLGGRLDATNVIHPLVSVITSIGLDHTEHLGDTLEKIAFEKGGIIKPGVPCVTGVSSPAPLAVLRRLARERRSELILRDDAGRAEVCSEVIGGMSVKIRIGNDPERSLFISLAGRHQVSNAATALVTLETLRRVSPEFMISWRQIADGLSNIRKLTGFRGRLDVLESNPLMISDVAHNPDGVRTLMNSLRKLIGRKFVTIFGVMRDKDYREMIDYLRPLSRLFIIVKPSTQRAVSGLELVREFQRRRLRSLSAGTVKEGIRLARLERRPTEPVLLTGSHYLVGEAMKCLGID